MAPPENCDCHLYCRKPNQQWWCPIHGRMKTSPSAEELGHGPARASEVMAPNAPLPESAVRAIAYIYRAYDQAEERAQRIERALATLEVDSDWPAHRLLDAIGDAIAVLRGADED